MHVSRRGIQFLVNSREVLSRLKRDWQLTEENNGVILSQRERHEGNWDWHAAANGIHIASPGMERPEGGKEIALRLLVKPISTSSKYDTVTYLTPTLSISTHFSSCPLWH